MIRLSVHGVQAVKVERTYFLPPGGAAAFNYTSIVIDTADGRSVTLDLYSALPLAISAAQVPAKIPVAEVME